LKTLPLWLGTQRYLWFCHGLNLLSFGVLIGAVLFYGLPWFALGLLTFFIYRVWYIERARRTPDRIPFLCHVAVDAEYLFWPVVVGVGLLLCWFA
jgi:4-hydroxybenzoate polyprenyltransferase